MLELILLLVNKYINSRIGFMKPVRQENGLGCAVACVAFVLKIPYSEALTSFFDGKRRIKEEANFYCPEIVKILNSEGLSYVWQKLKKKNLGVIDKNLSIVFIKKSSKYPYGHFLCRYNNSWMDPWINLPNKNIEAGFRKELPGEPTYVVFSLSS